MFCGVCLAFCTDVKTPKYYVSPVKIAFPEERPACQKSRSYFPAGTGICQRQGIPGTRLCQGGVMCPCTRSSFPPVTQKSSMPLYSYAEAENRQHSPMRRSNNSLRRSGKSGCWRQHGWGTLDKPIASSYFHSGSETSSKIS